MSKRIFYRFIAVSCVGMFLPVFAAGTGFEGRWVLDKRASNNATVPPPDDLRQDIKKQGTEFVVESRFREPANGIAPLLYLGIMTTRFRLSPGGEVVNQVGPYMQNTRTTMDGRKMTTDWTANYNGKQVNGQWTRTLSDDGRHLTLDIKEESEGQSNNASLHFVRK